MYLTLTWNGNKLGTRRLNLILCQFHVTKCYKVLMDVHFLFFVMICLLKTIDQNIKINYGFWFECSKSTLGTCSKCVLIKIFSPVRVTSVFWFFNHTPSAKPLSWDTHRADHDTNAKLLRISSPELRVHLLGCIPQRATLYTLRIHISAGAF